MKVKLGSSHDGCKSVPKSEEYSYLSVSFSLVGSGADLLDVYEIYSFILGRSGNLHGTRIAGFFTLRI